MKTRKMTIRVFNSISIFSALLIAGVLLGSKSMAQPEGFHMGGRLGIGESKIMSDALKNEDGKLMLTGGIATTYQFSRVLGLGADFLITSKGGYGEGSTTETDIFGFENEYDYRDKYRFIYMEVPVVGRFSIPLGDLYLSAFAGPSANFKLLGQQSRNYQDEEYNQDNGFENRPVEEGATLESALVYGLGVNVQADDARVFFLDLRKSQSFTSFVEVNNASLFHRYFSISAGCVF